jgi:hypothetical protein
VRSAEDGAAAREDGGGPQRLHVIVDIERRDTFGQPHPRQLRAGEDVDVRRQCRRIVQRAHAHEPERRATAIVAPERRLTDRAAIDLVRPAVVRRHGDRRRFARAEGMITDPVYEGKSMQAMIDLVRKGYFPAGSKVLYAPSRRRAGDQRLQLPLSERLIRAGLVAAEELQEVPQPVIVPGA